MKAVPPIDEKLVESYAKVGAENADIATLLGVSVRTLLRHCGPLMVRARAERRIFIRKFIWDCAKDGNASVLVWLGKTELGWCEQSQRSSHLEPPRIVKRFDFEAFAAQFAAEFARLDGCGAVTNGDEEKLPQIATDGHG